MKRLVLCTVVTVLILSLVATACAPKPAPEETKTFKLGVLASITGVAARTGLEQKNAVTMAFEEIDYKIGDYDIELVWIDAQADADKAARAYEEAVVRDGIQAGLNNFYSSVAIAVMEVAVKYKIPHFCGSAESRTIVDKVRSDPERYGYWMGKTWPIPDSLVAPPYLAAMNEVTEPGDRRIAVLSDDGEGPTSVRIAVRDTFAADGWEVVADEYFSINELEFYPLISKLRDQDPAAVLICTSAVPAISAFVKQAREMELGSVIIAHGLGWVGEWYEMTGSASDYVLDEIPQWTTDEAKEFAKRYEEQWDETPSPSSAGLAYDYAGVFIMVAERAIEKYGELTSETLYKVGQEELWTGQLTYKDGILMKEYKWTQDTYPDALVGKDHFIFPVIQYFGGEGKIVWPSEWAEAELQFPQ